ncbi:M56 family metallopeptidase [Eubacterium sp. An11]|uniref:M56 family metallopeptidase n=1 Tax=Eubacterium sp. An11 TaxID=1965542 RepID=UPI0013A63EB2|nr:M56 family metallopeptidase [Eubacterium sp. An11]
MEHFKFILHPDFHRMVLTILIIIWIGGSLFSIFRLLKKSRDVQKVIRDNGCTDYPEAAEVLASIDEDCHLSVRICSGISVPVLAGYYRPAIYFPEYSYTKRELRYILLHEYTHWRRHDIWKKLFMNIVCVLIWWNPAVYVIRKEVTQLIEFRCDKTLSKDFSDEEIVNYLDILLTSFERAQNPLIKTNLYTIEFVNTSKQYTIRQRFDLLLHRYTVTRHRWLPQALIVLLGLAWMFCSYYFILQTKYSFSEQSVRNEEVADRTVVDVAGKENAYLLEQEDGSYIFYFYGTYTEVSAEDVESGLYDFYPIIEYQEKEKNVFLEFFIEIQENIKNIFSEEE